MNVTDRQYKNQIPTVVSNTRAAELSKFVIYESPLTVVCDHPDNIRNQPGADFLKLVPTVWDDTRFVSGHPDNYIALARRNKETWFLGVMNNSKGKQSNSNWIFWKQVCMKWKYGRIQKVGFSSY